MVGTRRADGVLENCHSVHEPAHRHRHELPVLLLGRPRVVTGPCLSVAPMPAAVGGQVMAATVRKPMVIIDPTDHGMVLAPTRERNLPPLATAPILLCWPKEPDCDGFSLKAGR